MKCKKVKDLILTDYSDGRLDAAGNEAVRRHLAACAGCRAFAEEVQKTVVEPLRRQAPEMPPARVWEMIERRIGEDDALPLQESENIGDLIVRALLGLRPAAAVVFAACLIVAFFVISQRTSENAIEEYLAEQGSFLMASNGEANGLTDEMDFGTAIEEYFL
ncbi:MAG: zf-HC2 domain-containing protein [Candidatus Omnitrophica bacterium]|nr:zf-HC2 domain-containing protein [Candidatus Omnitrophota bacterium]